MTRNERFPVIRRVFALSFAKRDEVPCADGDVADFVVKDSLEHFRARRVARGQNSFPRRRSHVETARFEDKLWAAAESFTAGNVENACGS